MAVFYWGVLRLDIFSVEVFDAAVLYWGDSDRVTELIHDWTFL